MSGLFTDETPAVAWADDHGITHDGRRVALSVSPLTGRHVATIPLHGKDVVTRRSCRTLDETRAAAERAIAEGSQDAR